MEMRARDAEACATYRRLVDEEKAHDVITLAAIERVGIIVHAAETFCVSKRERHDTRQHPEKDSERRWTMSGGNAGAVTSALRVRRLD